jgi:hypothetical protein
LWTAWYSENRLVTTWPRTRFAFAMAADAFVFRLFLGTALYLRRGKSRGGKHTQEQKGAA